MHCPTCKIALRITERQGVEIEYCQQCRGLWVDCGELEDILDRSFASRFNRSGRYDTDRDYHEESRDAEDRLGYPGYRKKSESWFSRLFDLD